MLTSRFTNQDCQAFDTFARARTRRYPLFFAAKHAWVRLTDALPPRASQALRHHIELRANDAFRRVSRRQDRRSRR